MRRKCAPTGLSYTVQLFLSCSKLYETTKSSGLTSSNEIIIIAREHGGQHIKGRHRVNGVVGNVSNKKLAMTKVNEIIIIAREHGVAIY
jgi:hypothetical protein